MVIFTHIPTNVHVHLVYERLGTSSCSCAYSCVYRLRGNMLLVPTNVQVSYCERVLVTAPVYVIVSNGYVVTLEVVPMKIHVPVDCEMFSRPAYV